MNYFYYLFSIQISVALLLTTTPVEASVYSHNLKNVLLNLKFKDERLTAQSTELNLHNQTDTESILNNKGQVLIRVNKFIFVGNTVIKTKELEELTNKYLNKNIDIEKLLKVRNSITNLYHTKGYTTSKAKLLPLDVNQNLLAYKINITFNIVEGKVEKIIYQGSPRLKRYVVARLKNAATPIMNEISIQKTLRLLQKDLLIKSISAKQTPGSQSSSSVLSVNVKENNPLSASIILDNNRSPATGELERGFSIEDKNFLGNGDTLRFSYFNTEGSNKEVISYTSPFNSSNGTVQFSFNNSNNKIIERPFNLLDVNTTVRAYDLIVRQPIFSLASELTSNEFAVGLVASRIEAQSALFGNPFPLSPGSDKNGSTRLIVLRFFQEYAQKSNLNALYIRSQFSFGLGVLDANINTVAPDGRFFVWQGFAYWQRLLPYNFIFKSRSTIQIADRHLPSLEQLILSGSNTVRGYREDSIITDSGFHASVEVSYPLYTGSFGSLYIGPFVDSGLTWGNLSFPSSAVIASVGLGLDFEFNNTFSAHLDAAYPLIPLTAPEKTWQGNTLSFQLNYRF